MKTKILILDDEKRICQELSEYLLRKHYLVYSAGKPSTAFKILKNEAIDIIFLDLTLPEMDGIRVLKRIKKIYPRTDVIMISGHSNINLIKEAKQFGAIDFINKPFLHGEIQQAIESSVNKDIKKFNSN